ncbi:hypothetical protein SB5439_04992 [Klebsiella variicola]|uniref:phage major capsid protein n=1 Tax=Klebsiella variicola TaxID=244366 RepID=UPI00109C9048|nr:phage major capsid protein [Klebsiella variicola]VGQ11762.1 hypothetical protein SB5439_04992 [Klebsiella variicola]
MEQSRAYSLMKIKKVDEDAQIITGIASTPSPDRYSDIMEPEGAKFNLPLPLLWQHDPLQPIGSISKARVTKDGIEITAQIAKAEPGQPSQMTARLMEAWSSIKSGLVRGLSIGFRPIEYAYNDNGGMHFLSWDLMEVSAVTIPANAECSIQTIKNYSGDRAAFGNENQKTKPADKSAIKKEQGKQKMNIAEQIKAFETKRSTLDAERLDIMAKSCEMGETLDAEQTEKYDDLTLQIKSVDGHLSRLRDMEGANSNISKPVEKAGLGVVSTVVNAPAVIRVEKSLDKGVQFARYAKSLAAARGVRADAVEVAKQFYPEDSKLVHILKAAPTGMGTTTAGTKPLAEYQEMANDFVEYLRPQTILGKFGNGGIPALRQIPFNVRIPKSLGGGNAGWVGEGKAKPIANFDFETITFGYKKIASIAVLTDELVRFSNPSADTLIRNALADSLIQQMDADFIDVDLTTGNETAVKPASILYEATPKFRFVSKNDPEADIAQAFAAFVSANLTPSSGVWIMGATTALTMSMMRNPLGQKQYPDLTMLGGSLAGLPVIVSNAAEGNLVLVNASDIYLADDGGVAIDASREASLEIADPLVGDALTPKGASLVSMFQTNSIAVRAERWINWAKRRPEAVATITGVKYNVHSIT